MNRRFGYVMIGPAGRPARVSLPVKAKVLSVGERAGGAVVYFESEETKDREDRTFEKYETGDDLCEMAGFRREYVGTTMIEGRAVHVYERMAY